MECAGILDVAFALQANVRQTSSKGEELLGRVVAMLTKMRR